MRIGAAVIVLGLSSAMARAWHTGSPPHSPGQSDMPGVLASVDGEHLALEDVTARVLDATERERFDRLFHLGKYHFALFVQTLQEREKWIGEKLVEKAARARGVSVKEFVEEELKSLAARGAPADPEAIVRELRGSAAIRLAVPAFRLRIDTSNQPSLGSPTAEAEVVSFIDFYCGRCKDVETVMRGLLEEYPGRVRLVAMHFPLSPSDGPNFRLVEAAYCAAEQQRYWELRGDLLGSLETTSDPTEAAFRAGARTGLDNAKLKSCLDSRRYLSRVRAEQEEAAKLGVFGTPVVLVNGRRVPGADQPGAIGNLVKMELDAASGGSAK